MALLVPEAKPIILCNDVLSDPSSGNVHLIGVFDSIRPSADPAYPHTHPEFCVFVQLSDAVGTIPAFLRIVEASTLNLVFQTSTHSLTFARRLDIVRACFRIRDCSFAKAGVYWIELYCNAQFITDCRLRLLTT